MKRIWTKVVFTPFEQLGDGIDYAASEWYWVDDHAECMYACGAPSGQSQLAAAQANYYNTEVNIANQEFSYEQSLFETMSAEYTPIFNKGPNQYGFSAAENNALMTEAASGTAQDYNMAKQVAKEDLAAEGGANMLPSGVAAKVDTSLAEAGAQQIANEQQQVVEAGYQQGFEDWKVAAAGLGEAGSVFSTANQAAGVANSGGEAANQTYSAIAQENNSVFSTIVGGLAGAGGAAMSAWCPARGTQYLMADGTERPVETLQVGDFIMGIDDEPQMVEEIQSGMADILLTLTEDGHLIRTSPTHTFALPKGGFVVAARSLGKEIVTEHGTSVVKRTNLLKNKDFVFNIITDGSHTYRADGVWSLGVADDERSIGMNEWARIGNELLQEIA